MVISKTLSLPPWISTIPEDRYYPDDRDKMKLAIRLSLENVSRDHGGPFGAAVFHGEEGLLVSMGVNRVVPESCSSAHAEMVALTLAQEAANQYRLKGDKWTLVSSAQPCAMCFGALLWSGVSRLIYGAGRDAVIETGFDEGPLPEGWEEEMVKRGIRVVHRMMDKEAEEVLRIYREKGGIIY
jgi:tRNA(Arg) A34 adenosine deaminase TadA